jgi:hypothetical protein
MDEAAYVDCFISAGDQTNPERCNQAHQWLMSQILERPQHVLGIACRVLSNPSYPLLAQQMASFACSHTLKPTNQLHLRAMRENWPNDPQLITLTKSTLSAAVLLDDGPIRNQAALCIAYIIAIEQDASAEVPILLESLTSLEKMVAALSIFREIINLHCFSRIKNDTLMPQYYRLWNETLTWLGDVRAVNVDIRLLVAECVRDAVDVQ